MTLSKRDGEDREPVRLSHPAGEPDLNAIAVLLEGKATPSEGRRIEEHLAACAECRATLARAARSSGAQRRGTAFSRPAAAWLAAAAGLLVATLVGIRVASLGSGSSSAPGKPALRPEAPKPPREVAPSPAESAPERPAGSVRPPASEQIDETLLKKRSAEKRVAGKTFRLVAGEWVDAEFDPVAGLPVLEVRAPEDRGALFARLPVLAPYARLGDRVTVVLNGTVYRFLPASLPPR
jgi:hypothetical protein